MTKRLREERDDEEYFNVYSHVDVHEEMLRDERRTLTYRKAIEASVRDKVVLDVGCGTGVLSMFAVQAGAKHVYAVDASAMAGIAQEIVIKNGMEDRITVLKGKVEEVQLPQQVDILLSEWMGYGLFYECMLSSVLHARDVWLKPEGIMLPGKARLFTALVRADGMHEFWDSVYGFDMSPMKCLAAQDVSPWAKVEDIEGQDIGSDAVCLIDVNLTTIPIQFLDKGYTSSFQLQSHVGTGITGLCVWFDTAFGHGIVLSTTPYQEPTHWGQVLLEFPSTVSMEQDDMLAGTFELRRSSASHRSIDMLVSWSLVPGPHHFDAEPASGSHTFTML